jgi:DNA topoisomerase-1
MFPEREDGGDPRRCPTCGNGRLNLKLGKFGAFIGCSNYPECRYTRQLGRGDENGAAAEQRVLGVDPASAKKSPSSRAASGRMFSSARARSRSAEHPEGLLGRDDGFAKGAGSSCRCRASRYPSETSKPIMAGFGRFGPYISHDGTYASLESPEDVFTVGINRAVTLLAERKEKGGRVRAARRR